ncbi:DNA topoisomerase II [Rhizophagus clarus]|uniref:DNA topoisomerase (ATP-hydrolyzing) n=1 Tax=Rhizophagus clarus TaxID=94130 RepID=A0A8H3LUV2_9GLOM|nr:DNA topoisomerase II [Rhizophagus clarus]
MDTIKVDIDAKSELIFGHLLTSYDYYDNERKLLEVETVTVLNRRISLLMYLGGTDDFVDLHFSKLVSSIALVESSKCNPSESTIQITQSNIIESILNGSSAKALAVDGFSDYDLRGKLLIVREGVQDQINISRLNKGNIYFNKKIIFWPFYETNQDLDGGHTKGLIINFLNSSFRHCLKFRVEFITHIVQEITLRSRFYMREPTSWSEDNDEAGKLGITKRAKKYKITIQPWDIGKCTNFPDTTQIQKGAHIIFLNNTLYENGICNGSIALQFPAD